MGPRGSEMAEFSGEQRFSLFERVDHPSPALTNFNREMLRRFADGGPKL